MFDYPFLDYAVTQHFLISKKNDLKISRPTEQRGCKCCDCNAVEFGALECLENIFGFLLQLSHENP